MKRAWVEDVKRRKDGKLRLVGYRVRFRPTVGAKVGSEPGVFALKRDAETICAQVESRLLNGQLRVSDPHQLTETLVERWFVEQNAGIGNRKGTPLKEASLRTCRSNIQWFIRAFPQISACTEESLREWVLGLHEADLAPWTIHGILKNSKNFLRWSVRRKFILERPHESIVVSVPACMPRFYADDEIAMLEKAADGDSLHLALRLGYKCGLRRGEVLRLDKRDVRWLENGWGELLIWADESKNGCFRTVPLPPSVMQLLGSRGHGLIYPGVTPNAFEHRWTRLKAKSGIEDRPSGRYAYGWGRSANLSDKFEQARFHDLRHTFCRIFLETSGEGLETLQKITGHKSLDVLNRVYGHFQSKKLHAAMANVEARPNFVGVLWENFPSKQAKVSNQEQPGETLNSTEPNSDLMEKKI
jgi:integrase